MLKKETARTSRTSVIVYPSTRRHVSAHFNQHMERCDSPYFCYVTCSWQRAAPALQVSCDSSKIWIKWVDYFAFSIADEGFNCD
jgi:hypothetical protein